ncbi:heterokaryon incompatibility protein-domain-containing protein [Neurospora tetraspora]|uniref:Heterokaryon incompatibility protein-domain-containing protein n=1 Tax=Neurospora tetraspora TaxID=94610 RepID=A0AAE0MS04_9PEZI|nr:heterokaryon incompatibility protein-domain-containing protein [Neurospora tetraspora]
MTEPKESGLSSPDPENEHHHPPRPHLCSACSQIDFKALFTTHRRHNDLNPYEDEIPKACKCFETLETREKSGWPGPELADKSKPQCPFYAFYKDYLLRSRGITLGMERDPDHFPTGIFLKGFHSLKWFWVEHEGCPHNRDDYRRKYCRHYVQDVFALQFAQGRTDPGLGAYTFHAHNAGHAILRVVDDGPNHSALTRAREAGGGLLARRILPDQVNYNLIGEWLRLCQLGHAQCHGDGDGDGDVVTIPGFRVIDCTTGNIVSVVEALESGGKHDKVDYVTLSYVWGQAGFSGPVLREDGLSLPEELPLVISDAIEVVKRLGYRYLWIDRYCIPQDDIPSKQIQIQNMERIYSCSVLTIIAAAGEGPEYGLPGVSSRHRPEQLCVQVAEEISLALYESPKNLVTTSKWHTRGWTYQEGLLSKRRLIFTDLLVYFQCYEMHGDEVLSVPLPGAADSLDADGRHDQFDDIRYISFEREESDFGSVFPRRVAEWSDSSTIWDRIKEFAQRRLAFDADTLDAIAGIFGRYRSKTTEHEIPFFYSSSVNDISNSLTYKLVYNKPTDIIPTDRQMMRRSVFPSWSWADWKTCLIKHKNVVKRHFALDTCTMAHVEFEDEAGIVQRLDWETQNAEILNLTLQGGKIPACLTLRGTVLDIKLKLTSDFDSWSPLGTWTYTWPPFLEGQTIDCLPRVLFDDIEHEGGSDGTSTSGKRNEDANFLGLLLAIEAFTWSAHHLWIMMLKPVKRTLNGRPETMYERVHLLKVNVNEDEHERVWSALPRFVREEQVRLC